MYTLPILFTLSLLTIHILSPTYPIRTTWAEHLPSFTVKSRPNATEVALALQVKYDAVLDFTADFVHTYKSSALRTEMTERGDVMIKKPGKMRWNYTTPEKKLLVSDGVKIYWYVPDDKQVYVSDMPPLNEITTPVMFLSGNGHIVRDFNVSYENLTDLEPDLYALKLIPRNLDRDYEWFTLVVNSDTLQIQSLLAHDLQGGTSLFLLTNLKENVNLRDADFIFRIPRGTDVINSDNNFQE